MQQWSVRYTRVGSFSPYPNIGIHIKITDFQIWYDASYLGKSLKFPPSCFSPGGCHTASKLPARRTIKQAKHRLALAHLSAEFCQTCINKWERNIRHWQLYKLIVTFHRYLSNHRTKPDTLLHCGKSRLKFCLANASMLAKLTLEYIFSEDHKTVYHPEPCHLVFMSICGRS